MQFFWGALLPSMLILLVRRVACKAIVVQFFITHKGFDWSVWGEKDRNLLCPLWPPCNHAEIKNSCFEIGRQLYPNTCISTQDLRNPQNNTHGFPNLCQPHKDISMQHWGAGSVRSSASFCGNASVLPLCCLHLNNNKQKFEGLVWNWLGLQK